MKMKKEFTKEELKDFVELVLKDFKNHPLYESGVEYNKWTVDIITFMADHLGSNYEDLIKEEGELLDYTIECIQEFTHELVYTSDLTEWLNTNSFYIEYLTDALECEPDDGFGLLLTAYCCFVEDIKNRIVQYLVENYI